MPLRPRQASRVAGVTGNKLRCSAREPHRAPPELARLTAGRVSLVSGRRAENRAGQVAYGLLGGCWSAQILSDRPAQRCVTLSAFVQSKLR